MSLFQNIVIIAILIAGAGFLSLTEIALAGARKVKLKILAESGDIRAQKVLDLQENSANFFAASQIGLNAIAILGGILGEGAFRPYFLNFVMQFYQGTWAESISFALSFTLVTSLFILFADLMPKRMAMIAPEKIAVSVINPIQVFITVCKPLAWIINAIANVLFRLFKVNTIRDDNITFDDISAVMDAGAQAGVLQKQEHHFIENVFELEERTVPSSMTTRENIVYFALDESDESIRQKLAEYPYSKFLVCNDNIDQHNSLRIFVKLQVFLFVINLFTFYASSNEKTGVRVSHTVMQKWVTLIQMEYAKSNGQERPLLEKRIEDEEGFEKDGRRSGQLVFIFYFFFFLIFESVIERMKKTTQKRSNLQEVWIISRKGDNLYHADVHIVH